jgi:hypothetical protein
LKIIFKNNTLKTLFAALTLLAAPARVARQDNVAAPHATARQNGPAAPRGPARANGLDLQIMFLMCYF